MSTGVGVYPGLSFAEYQAIPAVNNSLLWTLKTRSPLHAKYERDHPEPPTPALLLGQALHALILEPATFDDRYAVRPECDRRTKEGRAIYEEFLLGSGGREEIKAADYEMLMEMAGGVRSQQCRELICSGRAEVTIVWVDEKTGLLCKAKLDYERSDWGNHFITDLKTTMDASREAFGRDIGNYGYFMQAAFYCDGWDAVSNGETSIWIWLAVEKSAPWLAKVWEAGAKTLRAGRKAYRAALDTWAECVEKNEWPGYGGPELIEMRDHALQREGVGPYDID